jgi:hypothetical protein
MLRDCFLTFHEAPPEFVYCLLFLLTDQFFANPTWGYSAREDEGNGGGGEGEKKKKLCIDLGLLYYQPYK